MKPYENLVLSKSAPSTEAPGGHSSRALVSDAQWRDFIFRHNDPYAAAKYEILMSWMGNGVGKEALVIGSGSGELCAILALEGAVLAVRRSKSSCNSLPGSYITDIRCTNMC